MLSLTGRVFGSRHRYHRGPAHFDAQIVRRHPQLNVVVLDGNDGAAHAAAGDHFVPSFELTQHLLPFLLFTLLRHDEKKVKYAKDEDERSNAQPTHRPATAKLSCKNLHVHEIWRPVFPLNISGAAPAGRFRPYPSTHGFLRDQAGNLTSGTYGGSHQ